MSGRHAAESPDATDTPRDAGDQAEAPLLRVVAGDPSPDELAAVTALLAAVEAARAGSAGTTSRPRSSAWTRSARAPRPAIVAGDGRWRGFSG
ncbi:acyl-CoA carboxylase epsilon subunit [Frigoribacterium sp. VKM Ac-2836]|uniref:acyl-CoA carboxylase epsilon subunit n=1 Tax=Frigoribacterium sp. VKM Ac-2836 TaxID=2739014 RepID=UPI0015674A9E|nr:acyl-CoA carboxylase subunit epsilon [Frigoribacterium sp. VKM Ac-2836]